MTTSSSEPLYGPRTLSASRVRELTYVCWGALVVGFVLPYCIVQAGMHKMPNADFVRFYSLGKLLNEYPASQLYNFDLQRRISVEVYPEIGVAPMPHPPFVGMVFRVFALFPYWAAYLAWVAITIALYASGLKMALARFLPDDRERRRLAIALAFAYFPFIGFTAISGQLTAVGFWGMTYAVLQDDKDRRFGSGLGLAMCLFKPTLFVLIGPMLLVSRRWRTLAGLATGGSMLVLITTAIEGQAVWLAFVKGVTSFGNGSLGSGSFIDFSKWVDLKSFLMESGLGAGGRAPFLMLICGCLVGFYLLQIWWRAGAGDKRFNAICWATTLTWTLVLNVYVPIYDTILVVLAAIITAGTLREMPTGRLHRWFSICIVCMLAVSFFTVHLAMKTGVQFLTLAISGFGALEIVLAMRIGRGDGLMPRDAADPALPS